MRARIRLMFDKSLGWIIVTIVGFLTAVVAFFVVRCEQLLFDLKEGYCKNSWWKAKRFCCPAVEDLGTQDEGLCHNWKAWSAVVSPSIDPETQGDNFIDYGSYIMIAVRYRLMQHVRTANIIFLASAIIVVLFAHYLPDELVDVYNKERTPHERVFYK